MKKLYLLLLIIPVLNYSQTAGDIIITEIMADPSAVTDTNGEWFEVYNTTGAEIDMNGWTIKDNGSNSHTINTELKVPAGGYAVLGINLDTGTNGNATVNYEYSSFTLSNSDDEIIIESPGLIEIDRVEYDGGPDFPDPTGASFELSSSKLNHVDNNNGSNWKENTTSQYGVSGTGDYGTPGTANDYTLSIEGNLLKDFKLFPNPTALGYVKISNQSNTPMRVNVFDVLGKMVLSSSVSNNKLDVSGLNTGLYLIRVSLNDAAITKKLVIQ